MTDTASWGWLGTGTWPSYTPSSQSPFGASTNGLAVNPSGYADLSWHDANADGVISDADTDDGSGAGSDRVVIGGVSKTVQDVGLYQNSTFVVNGATHTVPMVVWVFTDGTYMVRINDADIPPGVNHDAVTSIHLGKWDGKEYSGSYIATRDEGFVCFAAGTLIEAATGLVPVESLRPGDRVLTRDNGYQAVRWAGRRGVRGQGRLAPVRIAAGALGNRRDLWVSPRHRMLISDWRAELWFGAEEVLVPALHLVGAPGITRVPVDLVTYVHFLCDRHEIVSAEGAACESFHPGEVAMATLDLEAREEILSLFPMLSVPGNAPTLARPEVLFVEAALLRAAALPDHAGDQAQSPMPDDGSFETRVRAFRTPEPRDAA